MLGTRPMQTSVRRTLSLFSVVFASVSVLRAHPGHDDGHELIWDLGHLAEHPLATIGCVAVLAALVWGGWLAVARCRATMVRSQSLRGSQPSRGK